MNRNVNLEPKSPPISVLFTHPLSLQYLRSHKRATMNKMNKIKEMKKIKEKLKLGTQYKSKNGHSIGRPRC